MAAVAVSPTPTAAAQWEAFLEPYREAELASAEPGVIREILVAEGSRVTSGEVLLTLDSSAVEAGLAVARARAAERGALAATDAALRSARNRLATLDKLAASGHARAEELQVARADVEIARANRLRAEEERRARELEVVRFETELARHRIASPFDAVVVRVHKEVGEALRPLDEAAVTIAELDRLRIVFNVEPSAAREMAAGESVQIRCPELAAEPSATVEHVSPVTEADSGTVRVRAAVDNRDGRLRSGARCAMIR
ncbi:MAG: efflux RND transporter periplasmic adaptor subunit [Ectothiorhodospiraceae bacterium]|nr:efflux RND transporter periplasmic adaptor subunit [Chromatiales bacterium]MCP5154224.1 efflux RND transporter periplasmic adaptor subunit [Ectothiorhodospiraceae bacterium]